MQNTWSKSSSIVLRMQATFKRPHQDDYLALPPPDRAITMQSPPPSQEPNVNDLEDAPAGALPLKFMPEAVVKDGTIIFKPKYFKAPTIIITENN